MNPDIFVEKMENIFSGCDFKSRRMNDGFNGFVPVLIYLEKNREKNEITSGMISDKFNISTARVASMLNNLEEKNYIIREKSANDKRVTVVKITDLGSSFLITLKDKRDKNCKKAIEGIDDKDIDTFIEVLSKMMNNLKEEDK